MRWHLAACVLATGLLVGCASASETHDRHAQSRDHERMARNFDPDARDRIADELRAAEMRYASGDPDGATWDVEELLDATGDSRAAEVLGKFALYEGRFVAAERHFEDARNWAPEDDRAQLARLEDLTHLVAGFLAYEKGALADAENHWRAIQDADVRAGLADARAAFLEDGGELAAGGAR